MAVLLKNGHFQNVQFLKVDKQIIFKDLYLNTNNIYHNIIIFIMIYVLINNQPY